MGDPFKPDEDLSLLLKSHFEKDWDAEWKQALDFLKAQKLRSVNDFGLLASKEDDVKTKICDAAGFDDTKVGALVAMKRVWLFARSAEHFSFACSPGNLEPS